MAQGYHIVIYSISYLLFFALLWFSKVKNGNRLLDDNGRAANKQILIELHIGGILLLGILSPYFLNHNWQDIVFGKKTAGGFQVITTCFLTMLAVIIARRLAEKKYRQVRDRTPAVSFFNSQFIASYFFVRILFLCAYEIWFRGYLLTDSISYWGIPTAIIVNIILYVLLHSVNDKNEMFACIPFGLLICGLCIRAGAAWPAIPVHIALAASYEVHLVKRINKRSISFI